MNLMVDCIASEGSKMIKIEKYIFNSQNVYVQQVIYRKLIFPWETKYQLLLHRWEKCQFYKNLFLCLLAEI